jgi:hypothetical protein
MIDLYRFRVPKDSQRRVAEESSLFGRKWEEVTTGRINRNLENTEFTDRKGATVFDWRVKDTEAWSPRAS